MRMSFQLWRYAFIPSAVKPSPSIILSELKIIQAGENAVISVKGTEDKLIVSNYSENAENYLIKINGETLSLKEQISENSENKFIIGTDGYDYIVNDSDNTDIFAGANGDRVLANGNNNRVFGDSKSFTCIVDIPSLSIIISVP